MKNYVINFVPFFALVILISVDGRVVRDVGNAISTTDAPPAGETTTTKADSLKQTYEELIESTQKLQSKIKSIQQRIETLLADSKIAEGPNQKPSTIDVNQVNVKHIQEKRDTEGVMANDDPNNQNPSNPSPAPDTGVENALDPKEAEVPTESTFKDIVDGLEQLQQRLKNMKERAQKALAESRFLPSGVVTNAEGATRMKRSFKYDPSELKQDIKEVNLLTEGLDQIQYQMDALGRVARAIKINIDNNDMNSAEVYSIRVQAEKHSKLKGAKGAEKNPENPENVEIIDDEDEDKKSNQDGDDKKSEPVEKPKVSIDKSGITIQYPGDSPSDDQEKKDSKSHPTVKSKSEKVRNVPHHQSTVAPDTDSSKEEKQSEKWDADKLSPAELEKQFKKMFPKTPIHIPDATYYTQQDAMFDMLKNVAERYQQLRKSVVLRQMEKKKAQESEDIAKDE